MKKIKRKVKCGHLERPYFAKGMCRNCYKKNRYWTNPEARAKIKVLSMKRYQMIKNTEQYRIDARVRSKEYRERHPERHHEAMARYHLKQLDMRMVIKIYKEVIEWIRQKQISR